MLKLRETSDSYIPDVFGQNVSNKFHNIRENSGSFDTNQVLTVILHSPKSTLVQQQNMCRFQTKFIWHIWPGHWRRTMSNLDIPVAAAS